MKKQLITIPLLFLSIAQINAQDIYKVESFASTDLTGTSRYVSMGGAMDALGADISTISSNPAGIGLFRRNEFSTTASLLIQPSAEDFADRSSTRLSYDQAGLVFSLPFKNSSLDYVNIGFNYLKRKNFKDYVGAINIPTNDGMSQSWQMVDLSWIGNGWIDFTDDNQREWTTPLTNLGYDTQMILPIYDEKGENIIGYEPSYAKSYQYQRARWGGIQQYDFNISTNFGNQVYAGLTFGVQSVDYHSALFYGEQLLDADGGTHPYYMQQEESVTGNGFDIKMGVILRPIEESPFRIGFSVHTPTWYNLTTNSYLYMNSPYQSENANYSEQDVKIMDYQYKIRTPWKFNLSLGTTIGTQFAIGASYEYADYSSSSISYEDYGYMPYESYFTTSSKDHALNEENKRFLNGVSTVKVGVEARFTPDIYLRAGYNYISSPHKDEAYLNLFTTSDSYYYSTNTDYINLKSTHRATVGLGWKGKKWYADAAYLFQTQGAELYPFHYPDDNSEINLLKGYSYDIKQHKLQLTLGYRF